MKAEPVAEKTIKMSPTGCVALAPGEAPKRWETRFVTEHLRRSARKGDDAATAREVGPDVLEVAQQWRKQEQERRSGRHLVHRLLAAFDGPPRVRVRIVFDLVGLEPLTSETLEVPPVPMRSRRVLAALRQNR